MNSVTEKIDERILRLLGLQDVFDIDYDTYYTLIREAMVAGAKKLPEEELAVLANERKRIRGKKGRFKPKTEKPKLKSKVSTAKFLKPSKKVLALPPAKVAGAEEEQKGTGFFGIRKTLDSILQTLTSKFKFDQKQADQERRKEETSKRGKRESTLEGFKKGVAGIVATTKKLLSPFQSIIDRIKRFIFFTLLGRAFTKFMDWLGDKENQKKFDSLIEFLSDHFPAIAGLYILFGTSFGKLVRGLIKGAVRMVIALGMNIPKIASFIRKNKKLVGLGLGLASLGSGFISREVGNLFGDKETPESKLIPTSNPDLDQAKQSADQAKNTEISTLNFGGMIPKFNFGGMVPSFKMGGMNAFPRMDVQSGIPITGAGKDDTLIAAKTGEAILTEKDQVDLSQRYVDRTTGQPLNIPQYLSQRKPGQVNMSNLRFPGFGGGFFRGGMIPKFNVGGMIGGGKFSSPKSLNPLEFSIQNTQDKQAERNNPFSKFSINPSFTESLASNKVGSNAPLSLKGGGRVTPNITKPKTSPFSGSSSFGDIPLIRAANAAGIKGLELAAFLSQTSHETGGYKWDSELGGGSDTYGGGKRFKGRGYIQLTHDYNYKKYGDRLGIDLLRNPDLARSGDTAAKIAVMYWMDNVRPLVGNKWDDIFTVSRAVNNPSASSPEQLNGWDDRVSRFNRYRELLKQGSLTLPSQKPATKPKPKSKGRRSTFSQLMPFSFIPSSLPFQGGGSVKENTGTNIPGATADRQLTALQPGEYVIPKDSVDHLGTSFFDKLVAMTDSNSNPYLGRGIARTPQITPYKSMGSNSGTITLPPISQSAGGVLPKSSGGSSVPGFSARHPNGMHYKYAEIYGIAG